MLGAHPKYDLKKWISCCHCKGKFEIDTAEFCDCSQPTLKCPHCHSCACHKVEEWRSAGLLVPLTHRRFVFVHKDLIAKSERLCEPSETQQWKAVAMDLRAALEKLMRFCVRPGDDGRHDDGYDDARNMARTAIDKMGDLL